MPALDAAALAATLAAVATPPLLAEPPVEPPGVVEILGIDGIFVETAGTPATEVEPTDNDGFEIKPMSLPPKMLFAKL